MSASWSDGLDDDDLAVMREDRGGEMSDKGFSEERCVRCGWRMGSPPLNCQNDDTPHRFPSQGSVTAPDRKALAETVRATLDRMWRPGMGPSEAHAALAALAQPCDCTPTQHPSLESGLQSQPCQCEAWKFHAETLEERLAEAERRIERSINWDEYDRALTERAEQAEQRAAALEARLEQALGALTQCRELFVDLRGDWSDNRGPCREGIEIINRALAATDAREGEMA